MRFLTCGADGILVELADLDETLRVFAALQSAVKHAVEQTAESPERAAQPSTTSVFAGVKQLIPAARTVYVAFVACRTDRRDSRAERCRRHGTAFPNR